MLNQNSSNPVSGQVAPATTQTQVINPMSPALSARDIILQAADSPTAEEQELRFFYEQYLLSTEKEYPEVEYLLEVNGVPYLSVGDLTLVQAQAKSGKTTYITLLTAALLAGEWGPLRRLREQNKIVVFDTEQYIADTNAMYLRMLAMGQRLPHDEYSELKVLNLRKLDFSERRRMVARVLLHERPSLAVIDGIRDLVPDINDPIDCPRYVQELMQLATEVECALVVVLHNNMGDNTARGWIGKEIINKCGAATECKKVGNVMTFENTVFRRARVPKWQVVYSEGIPTCDMSVIGKHLETVRAEREQEVSQKRSVNDEEHLSQMRELFGEALRNGINRSELVKQIIDHGMMKRTAAQDLIKRLLERGFLQDMMGLIMLPPSPSMLTPDMI